MPKVSEHIRSGYTVRQHSRWAAGGRQQLAILVIALVVAAGAGAMPAAGGAGNTPHPQNSPVYPVKLPGSQVPPARPKPAVTYPIPWDQGRS
ncbi:hypothetical protein ACFXKR_18310 [Streptomyces violascens]|uniref:hypothetical protein n=1 Tax=Streptomyces violascens TaxID=67381 RepID=UPI00367D8C45